jgi:2'-5' RNA ligase
MAKPAEQLSAAELATREKPKRVRLFVALNAPADLQKTLGEIGREAADLEIRWTPAEQLHLTLKFLGYIDERLVGEIQSALENACRAAAASSLRAAGLGCFPNANRPRILWAGIEGNLEGLLDLQSRVEAAVSKWVEPEARPFSAHLTLARIKELRPASRIALKDLLHRHAETRFGQWEARQVDLMQSVPGRSGSIYRSLGSIPLRPS